MQVIVRTYVVIDTPDVFVLRIRMFSVITRTKRRLIGATT